MVRSLAIDEDVRKTLLVLWNTESSLVGHVNEAHDDDLISVVSIISETRKAIEAIEAGFKRSDDDVVVLTNERAFVLCGQARKDTLAAGS